MGNSLTKYINNKSCAHLMHNQKQKTVNLNAKYDLKGDGTEDITDLLNKEYLTDVIVVLERGTYLVSNVRATTIYLYGNDNTSVVLKATASQTGIMLNPTQKYDIRNIKMQGNFNTSTCIGNDDVVQRGFGRGVLQSVVMTQCNFGIFFGTYCQHPIGVNYSHLYAQAIKTAACVLNGDGSTSSFGEDAYLIEETLFTNGGGSYNTTYACTSQVNTPNTQSDTITWVNDSADPYFGYTVFRSANGVDGWHTPPNWFQCDYKSKTFVASKSVGETWFYRVHLTNVGLSISRAKNVSIDVGHAEDFVIGNRFKDCPSVHISTSYMECRLMNLGFCSIHANNSTVITGPGWCEGSSYAVISASNSTVDCKQISVGAGVKNALFGLSGATQQTFMYSGKYNSAADYDLYRDIGGSTFNHNNEVLIFDTNPSADYVQYPTAGSRLRKISSAVKSGYEVQYRGNTLGGMYAEANYSWANLNYIELQPQSKSVIKVPIQNTLASIRTNLSSSASVPCLNIEVPINTSGTIQIDFTIRLYDGSSVARQVFGGQLSISAISASGTCACGVSFSNMSKAGAGTITIPATLFTTSVSGSVCTISCVPIDSSITSMGAGYGATLFMAPNSVTGFKPIITVL